MKKRWILAGVMFGCLFVCIGLCAGIPTDVEPAVVAARGSPPTKGHPVSAPGDVAPAAEADPTHGMLVPPDRTGSADEMMTRSFALFRGQRTIRCALPFAARAPDIAAQRSTGDTWIRADDTDTDMLFVAPGVGLVRVIAPPGGDDPVAVCTSVTVVAPEVAFQGTVVDEEGAPRADVSVKVGLGGRPLEIDADGRFSAGAPEGPAIAYVSAPEGSYALPFVVDRAAPEVTLVTDAALSLPPDVVAARAATEEVTVSETLADAFHDLARDVLGGTDTDAAAALDSP